LVFLLAVLETGEVAADGLHHADIPLLLRNVLAKNEDYGQAAGDNTCIDLHDAESC
jgi:hypothetical protein